MADEYDDEELSEHFTHAREAAELASDDEEERDEIVSRIMQKRGYVPTKKWTRAEPDPAAGPKTSPLFRDRSTNSGQGGRGPKSGGGQYGNAS